MFRRALILFVLFVPVAFCGWYLLRNTPGKQVLKLRHKISVLLSTESRDDYMSVISEDELSGRPIEKLEVRLDLARQASDEILSLFPDSQYDREMRGVISEHSGNLVDALTWYEGVSGSGTYPARIELRRARILRTLGRFGDARGAYLSVVDSYPFRANLDLGQLYMDFWQFDRARQHLLRAKTFASTNEQTREASTLLVHALNSLSRISAGQSKNVDQAELRHELELAIADAIGAWNTGMRSAGKEFVLSNVKVAELLTMKGKSGVSEAIELLRMAGKGDYDNDLVPIHLTLGTLLLASAETGDFPPKKKARAIKDAEVSLLRALDLDVNRATQTLSKISGFERMAALSRRDIGALVLARTSRAVLGTDENWRLLVKPGVDEHKDGLDLSGRIRSVIDATPRPTSDPIVSELGIIRALATLVNGDRDDAVAQLDALIESAGASASRVAFAAANMLASLDVDDMPLLLTLLEVNSESGRDLAKLKTLVMVLHQRRMRLKDSRSPDMTAMVAKRHADLTARIRSLIEGRARITQTSEDLLILFHWSRRLVDDDFSESILSLARKKFPGDERVLIAYAVQRLRNAESHEDQTATYHETLNDLVPLYSLHPENAHVLELAQLALRGLDRHGAPVAIERIVGEALPRLSKPAGKQISQAMLAIFRGDWGKRLAGLESFADHGDPFYHYVLGMYWVEKAGRLSLRMDGVKTRKQFQALARRHFEAGARANPDYVPIIMESLKLELDGVAAGAPVPEALRNGVKRLAKQNSRNAPVQFLHALVWRAQRSHFFEDHDGKSVVDTLRRERSALRKAIRANPDFTTAYILLAETFVVGWENIEDVAYLNSEFFRLIGSPDFDKALTVLRSARPSTSILRQSGRYLQARKDFPGAISRFKRVFRMAPSQASLHVVVSAYLAANDIDGAENWLSEVEATGPMDFDFDVAVSVSKAMIVHQKWTSGGAVESEKASVEEEQIRLYRRVLESVRATGEAAPPVVLNNLAYLLCSSDDEKQREEAIALLEPLKIHLVRGGADDFSTSIQDTYAWVLQRNGRLDEALELYESIIARSKKPEYRLGYAQVLVELHRFEDAKRQVGSVLDGIRLGQDKVERRAKKLQNRIEEALRERIIHTSRI